MTETNLQSCVVHVVEPDVTTRRGLAELLRSVQLPVEAYASAAEFIANYVRGSGGCAVAAMRMPEMSGLDLLRWLNQHEQRMSVVITSEHGDAQAAMEAIHLGAADYIPKPYSEQLLLERLVQLHTAQKREQRINKNRDEVLGRLRQLTERERQIVTLIVAGYATKQIAVRLGISYKTVENRRRGIHDKLRVEGLAHLVAMVVPVLGGCGGEDCGEAETPCGLNETDRMPCQLNPVSGRQQVCPLASPGAMNAHTPQWPRLAV